MQTSPCNSILSKVVPMTQHYRKRRAWKVSSCHYMGIQKIHAWQCVPLQSISRSENAKGHLYFVLVLSNILQNILSKSIAAITAVTKSSMKPRSRATTNCHLCGIHSGEKNGKQRRTKVSFGRTMMQALELLWLAKRHILGWSYVEQ